MDVLRLVVSFVGPRHYRFIAGISQRFHAAYIEEFPDDTETELNASTVEYAEMCWEALEHPSPRRHQLALSYSAATHGCLPAMQYLRSVFCLWDEMTCAYAAKKGHLNILRYARDRGCPWDERTCSYATGNGHLNILDRKSVV